MEQHNLTFDFWEMAYKMRNGISIDMLRQAVVTDKNPSGDISKEEFKEISGVDFEVKETKPVEPQPTTPTPTPVQPTTPISEPVPPIPQEQPTQPVAK